MSMTVKQAIALAGRITSAMTFQSGVHKAVVTLAKEVERLQTQIDNLDILREGEDSTVSITCDNPDFGGPTSLVDIYAEWTGYRS